MIVRTGETIIIEPELLVAETTMVTGTELTATEVMITIETEPIATVAEEIITIEANGMITGEVEIMTVTEVPGMTEAEEIMTDMTAGATMIEDTDMITTIEDLMVGTAAQAGDIITCHDATVM